MRLLSVAFGGLLHCTSHAFPTLTPSLLTEGLKFPNRNLSELEPVRTFAVLPDLMKPLPGFSELTEYALASPDQEEAGTCLYMSLTGILEWWLARLHPGLSRAPDGDVDLSERFTINEEALLSKSSGVSNWKTDSVEVFNRLGYAVTNRSYPFTKGYFNSTPKGYVAAQPGPGVPFGTQFNWINQMAQFKLEKVALPHFSREVLFADPDGDPWGVDVAPDNLVDLIKEKLRTRLAPVQVIYNHYGYWHATVIVGFDDDGDSQHCQFVEGFRKFMKDNPAELRKQAEVATTPKLRKQLLAQAHAQDETSQTIESAWQTRGGCVDKGIFYVRDSIYGADDQPIYEYNASYPQAKGNYSKRLVNLEYDWVKYLANHAVQIFAD